MQVEIAHYRANLIELVGCRAMGRIVLLPPQYTEFAGHFGKVGGQGAPTAHFAAVEPRVAHAIRLDVNGFLCGTLRVAQHIHKQIVPADVPEQRFVAIGRFVAAGRPPGVGLRWQASGGD